MALRTCIAALLVVAGNALPQPLEVPVWPNGMPDSNGITEPEVNDRCAANISTPTLSVYRAEPSNATRAGVLVIPGGGYGRVCLDHEGDAIARRLNQGGVTGFVLKYRLPNGHSTIPLRDAQQALKMIRAKAGEWGVDSNRVGVMGFSAGGHLASTVGTHFKEDIATELAIEGQSVRPDFMVLVYPVVTLRDPFTHKGSRSNLLGPNPDESRVNAFSNELRVSAETPPTFIVHAMDDDVVPIENSLQLVDALRAQNVPAELHAFETGGHGFGLGSEGTPAAAWPELCLNWLRRSGFLGNEE